MYLLPNIAGIKVTCLFLNMGLLFGRAEGLEASICNPW
jgi:hypothetical protein